MSTLSSSIAALAAIWSLTLGHANAQLQAVGPVHPDHGFPTYYLDAGNQQLAPCMGNVNLCLLDAAADLLNPGQPFPLNYGGVFPSHLFYNAAEATMGTNGGGTALLVMALQGGFGNDAELPLPGDQFVMSRLRIRIDNLVVGANYHITTPYGVFDLVATTAGRRSINFTIDVPGPVPGAFAGALVGPIGPTFLRWDRDLPIVDANGNQYIGNPDILHTITGSPFGTNFFRIEGPNVGGTNVNSIETSLFAVVGMLDPGAPVAAFTATPTSGAAPLAVAFSDLTAGQATSWSWNFGDGSVSNLRNPSHVYQTPGTYAVSLTASGAGGSNSHTEVGYITVTQAPVALLEPVPGTGGMVNLFTVTGVTAGSDVYLYWSHGTGSSPIALRGCGIASGLQRPTVLSRRNADGTSVTMKVKINPALVGHTVHLQAVDASTCRTSSVVGVTF